MHRKAALYSASFSGSSSAGPRFESARQLLLADLGAEQVAEDALRLMLGV